MTMTSNQPSVVDDDAFTVRRSITIAAAPEKVWAAVTRPEHISRWFGHTEFGGDADVAVAPGASGTITWPGREPVPVRVEAMDAPHSVSYRWSNPCLGEPVPDAVDDSRSTLFTFTLEPTASGTMLTVVESGFETLPAPADDMESHRGGWNGELDKLVVLLESEAASAGAGAA